MTSISRIWTDGLRLSDWPRAKLGQCAADEHGAICDDIEVALDMTHQTASARVHELAWVEHATGAAFASDAVTKTTKRITPEDGQRGEPKWAEFSPREA